MTTRLTLSFYGDVQLDRTLARFGDAVSDARPAWEAITRRFVALEKRQFSTEGAAASGGWAPLSANYAEWKAAHYPGKTILRRTDDLYHSLTRRPLPIEVHEPTFMAIGSDVGYGEYHQHGGGNLPQRRPVELTEDTRREWVKILQRFIVTGKA